MAMTIGVGALIGVALGLRFNVFFLIEIFRAGNPAL
jgi:hypothetical protein